MFTAVLHNGGTFHSIIILYISLSALFHIYLLSIYLEYYAILAAMTLSDRCHDFEFDCGDGQCIRRSYMCDGGDPDCVNGADELFATCNPEGTMEPKITVEPLYYGHRGDHVKCPDPYFRGP